MRVKKSRYVHIYNNDASGNVIFNSKNLCLLEGDNSDIEKLNSYTDSKELENDEISLILFDKGMLVEESADEKADLIEDKRKRYKAASRFKKNRIGYLRISLTENCNMACKYCFVDRISKEKANMPTELFVKIMNWFIEQNKNSSPLIQYFGGEPLLRMDLIKLGNTMLLEAKKQGIIRGYVQEVVTNGTLLNESVVQFMIDNHINVSVSMDGFKEIHDMNRIFKDGTGSFDKAVQGLKNYEKAGGKVSLFITPTNDNIDRFADIIPYFVEELHAEDISVNTPQPYKFGWEIDGQKVAEAIQNTLLYAHEKNIRYNIPGNNILFLINNKVRQSYSCMNLTYGKDENSWGVYINSQGRVSKCVVECDERCSKEFDDFVMDEEFINWHFQPSYLEACLNCPATNVCGGPCSVESLITNGGRNPSKCQFMNSMLKWVMENDK